MSETDCAGAGSRFWVVGGEEEGEGKRKEEKGEGRERRDRGGGEEGGERRENERE